METINELDAELLKEFRERVLSKAPHVSNGIVENPSPLADISKLIIDCAREEYGINLPDDILVYGKFESRILYGSVKTRPALKIIEEAIKSGKLKRGCCVFEATSGNFGISLSMLSDFGINVFVLVSRRLKEGVIKALEDSGAKIIQLDMDICPAPGLKANYNEMTAKLLSEKLLSSLENYGLSREKFESRRTEIEALLAKEDIIGLAKALAKAYNGFCPEQYDSPLNPLVHEETTALELDQQLSSLGQRFEDFDVVCSFGTGGTSLGISNYLKNRYGVKKIRIVFPLEGQDVAGIRSKDKAVGLRFYRPDAYLGEHVVDFEQAKKVLNYFSARGISIGESSALVIYAIIQMINFGVGKRFIAIIADGNEKYGVVVKPVETSITVSTKDIKSDNYDAILWTHTLYTPNEKAVGIIAEELGIKPEQIGTLKTSDVFSILSGKIPDNVAKVLQSKKILFICMAGGTSLSVAKVLRSFGYNAFSLEGGLISIAQKNNVKPNELVNLSSG